MEAHGDLAPDGVGPAARVGVLVLDEPVGRVVELLNVLRRRQGQVVDRPLAPEYNVDHLDLRTGQLVLDLVLLEVV